MALAERSDDTNKSTEMGGGLGETYDPKPLLPTGGNFAA